MRPLPLTITPLARVGQIREDGIPGSNEKPAYRVQVVSIDNGYVYFRILQAHHTVGEINVGKLDRMKRGSFEARYYALLVNEPCVMISNKKASRWRRI